MFRYVRIASLIPLILALLVAGASAAGLDEAAFTRYAEDKAATAYPKASVTVLEPLLILVALQSGTKAEINLTKPYQDYQAEPQRLNAILAEWLATALAAATTQDRLKADRIIPLVKDREWLDEANKRLRDHNAEFTLAHEPLNEDLIVVYADNLPDRVAYLSEAQLRDAGLDPADRRKRAINNLIAEMPQATIQQLDGLFLAYPGHDFAASALLFDSLWQDMKSYIKGDFVVAVPARDVVLFTGSEDAEGIAQLRAVATEIAANRYYRLTAQLFLLKDGTLTRFAD